MDVLAQTDSSVPEFETIFLNTTTMKSCNGRMNKVLKLYCETSSLRLSVTMHQIEQSKDRNGVIIFHDSAFHK